MFSKISKTPLIHDHFHIAAIFTRRSCYNLFWKVRIIHYKLSIFFQCCFTSRTEIIMVVCSFWIFFQESFFEKRPHISMKEVAHFQWSDLFFGGKGTLFGLHLIWWDWSRGQKIHRVGDTPIIPLPTMANPGLCCNRIKKKQVLQNIPENFTDTFHWSILKTFPRSVQIYLMVDFKMLLDWSSH